MKIINKINNREITIRQAIGLMTNENCDDDLRDLIVRILEELTESSKEKQILSANQLSRIFAYNYEVREESEG